MIKNKLLTIAAILGVLSLLAAAAVSVGTADESAAQPDFTGYTAISTPQQLALIGNDPNYPLNGAYYLDDDISFASVDTNGGADIDIYVTKTGTGLVIVLTPLSGSVSSVYAKMGASSSTANSGTLTLTNIPQGVNVLTIGGQLDSSVPFAYSVEIDTTANGVKVNGTFNSNGNFDPIGPANNRAFTGLFNGNGKTISGMNVAVFGTSDAYAGLFGYLGNNAQISDLGMIDGSVTAFSSSSDAYAGGIFSYAAAYATSMTMTNCYNTGLVAAYSPLSAYAGGIVGFAAADSLTLTDCYNTGTITIQGSDDTKTGGIIGYAMTMSPLTITHCYNTGLIATSVSSLTNTGGIIGSISSSETTISGCYNTGSVTAAAYSAEAGGIVGDIISLPSAVITDCYNTGSVTVSSTGMEALAGGIVAFELTLTVTVTNCYNTGQIMASSSSSSAYAGGIVCSGGMDTTVSGCHNDGPVTASASSSAYAGGIVSSSTQPTTITDCYNTGQISASSSATSSSSMVYAGGVVGFATSTVTVAGCHNDGSVSASSTSTVTASRVNAGGIVGYTTSKITITDCYSTGSVSVSASSAAYSGGILGYAMATTTSMTITGCHNDGSVSASSTSTASASRVMAGGIFGYAAINSLTATDCYNTGPVTIPLSAVAYAGGLFGNAMGDASVTFTGCYNTGPVTASASRMLSMTGGIAGSASSSVTTFADCYNTGSVDSSGPSPEAGGIVADIMSDTSTAITGCYNTGTIASSSSEMEAVAAGIVASITSSTVAVNDCYNTGTITSSSSSSAYAGGIACNAGASTIAGCYNTGPVTASASSSAYVGGITSSVTKPTTITNCHNTGQISASSSATSSTPPVYAGGIVGYIPSTASSPITITGCYNTGLIEITSSRGAYAGGIAGYIILQAASLTIKECYNTGTIAVSSSGPALAGGIAGQTSSPSITITECHNTGSVTVSSNSAQAGGIVGQTSTTSTVKITDCYNTGSVTASSPFPIMPANAGGIVGFGSALPITIFNCYNTGSVAASATVTANAGGIAGTVMPSSTVTNCYFLEGQIEVKGVQVSDVIYGFCSGTVTIDGGMVRSNGQDSGAKSASDMKPSLGDARAGNSIYFTGMTTVGSESVPGWDFDDIWVIFSEVNDGYPMPRSEASTVSGIVTEGVNPVAGATISYNGTYVTTDSAGRYVITVPYGSVVTITDVSKARHALRESLPLTFTLTSDVVQNFTMDKILLETSGEKIGAIGVVEGTADASSGASWVSINVRFDDGSFQRNVSRLVYFDSVAEFYVEFSSSSAQPVMYVVLLTDQRPVYNGTYTPLAMDAGGF